MSQILIFTGITPDDKESAIEGMCKKSLQEYFSVTLVYFDKNIIKNYAEGNCLYFEYKYRRSGLSKALKDFIEIGEFNFIIVRNLFNVLDQVTEFGSTAKIGFWESFPHSYQRLEKAHTENKAVIRKKIEYSFKLKSEKKLISRCDFFMPITEKHKELFYSDLTIPYFPTPMGIDLSGLKKFEKIVNEEIPIRFVYIGVISEMRKFDLVNDAFLKIERPFILDYYSKDDNEIVDRLKQVDDPRINFRGYLDRDKLFEAIKDADVGLSFYPHTKTFIIASPTKTLEYCALGLTVLANDMPEYSTFLNKSDAYICDFNEESICKSINEILDTSKSSLKIRGENCQKQVMKYRTYDILAKQLSQFLHAL